LPSPSASPREIQPQHTLGIVDGSAAAYCQSTVPFDASIANTSFAPVTTYMIPL
jgi:hypothetical protein